MPLFYNRIKEQLIFFDSQKTKMLFFSIFSNMILNIDIYFKNSILLSIASLIREKKNKSIM